MLKCDNKIHISENKSNLHVEKMIKCDTIVSKEKCEVQACLYNLILKILNHFEMKQFWIYLRQR